MPNYEHKCKDETCNYEWEETYSIKADPPKICPKCNKETAQRLISNRGLSKMDLVGDDLINKVNRDTMDFRKEVFSNENTYANFIGEDKYQSIQKQIDKNRK